MLDPPHGCGTAIISQKTCAPARILIVTGPRDQSLCRNALPSDDIVDADADDSGWADVKLVGNARPN